MVLVEQQSTLLVAYDVPSPLPLQTKRPVRDSVGVAMVLTPQRTARTLATLGMQPGTAAVSTMSDAALESLRLDNPAARALPLLALLARQQSGSVVLKLPGNAVTLQLALQID